MFSIKTLLFGERSVTKVAGLFASRAAADLAASGLVGGSGLSASQVNVLGPTDGESPATPCWAAQWSLSSAASG